MSNKYEVHLNKRLREQAKEKQKLDATMRDWQYYAQDSPVLDSLTFNEKQQLQNFLDGRIEDWKSSSPDNISLMAASARKKYEQVLAILKKLNNTIARQRSSRTDERRALTRIEQQLSRLIDAAQASERAAAEERRQAGVFREYGYTTLGEMQSKMHQNHDEQQRFQETVYKKFAKIDKNIDDMRVDIKNDIRKVHEDVNANHMSTLTALGKSAVVLTGAGGVLTAALPVAAAAGGVAAVTGVIAGTTFAVERVCTWMNIDGDESD